MTKTVKRQILAAQLANKRSELNEDSLYLTLSAFFEKLKQKVLKELDLYYNEDAMLQGQVDLILAPIHISQRTYYRILKKHIKKEYQLGVSEAKRIVKLAQKNNNTGADKAEKIPINSIIKKGELFGTSEYSRQKLFNQSFKASESTMARIDSDINKILSDGYTQGWGQNAIAADINKRFDQLKDWEAKRIARTEIHNAHNMAMMQTYEEMDVEYIQWNAASDARVRDSHKKLSGEITKLGEKFSNNLSYPGDTEGNIKEWINCRCVNSPFLIPPGYMAPSFTPFREKDLIPTLDYWNQDEIISQATQELSSSEYNSLERQLLDIKRSENEWDINRLTPDEREVYLKAKKNYLILKDARDNHNYSNLDSLEDAGSFYQINSKAKFMEYTDNGTDFEGWLNDELAEYLDDIERYEKIIKDTNIKVTIEPKRIKWNNPQLKDDYYVINPETGEYEFFNMDEKFIKYHFKKENLTILESVDMPTSRVRSLYKQYKKLPARLQNTREIVLSSQKPVKFSFMGEYRGIGGYVVEGKGTRIVQFRKSMAETVDTVVHEATHNLEKDKLFYISNSKEYVLAFKKDQNRLLSQGKELEYTYITRYAHEFTEDALKTNSIYKNRIYSEDLAESMKMYLKNKETFTETYPEKAKVLEKILDGKFNPKTTIPYKKWADLESERFTLTQEELQKYSKLRWKQTDLAKEGKMLTAAERKELKFYEDKTKMDWLYRKKIEGEHLTSSEEKTFKELSQKYKKKLKITKDVFFEEVEEEIPPKVRMRKEIMKSQKDLYKLTKDEEKLLKELQNKTDNEKMGFLEKRRIQARIKELIGKRKYNEMRNAVIDRRLGEVDWDHLEELHNKFKYYKTAEQLKKFDDFKIKINSTKFENKKAFHLSDDEKEVYEILKKNEAHLENNQRRILKELEDRNKLAKLHEKLLDENYFDGTSVQGLDNAETRSYFELYKKYKEKWKLPDIDIEKIKWDVTVSNESKVEAFLPDDLKRLDETNLTYKEEEELRRLLVKKSIGEKTLTAKELDRLDYLKTRRDFNDIFSLRKQQNGLFYKEEKIYYKLYHKLEAKGQFKKYSTEELIAKFEKYPQKIYYPKVKWEEGSNLEKLKGITSDGIPEGISDLTDLFTMDTRNGTQFEQDLAFDWLGADYKRYREFLVTCKGDVKKYAKLLERTRGLSEEEALENALETAYNTTKLCNLLNNQTKKPMTLWRCETKLHLGDNPKIGDIVTFEGINSTAVTKEGMKFFESNSKKTITAYIEIEAPAGTRGAYLAPISPSKFKPEMELLLQKDTKCEIVKLGTMNGHKYAKVRIVNKYDFDEVLNSSDINLKLR